MENGHRTDLTGRKPRAPLPSPGAHPYRTAARAPPASLPQEPPRITRREPAPGPVGRPRQAGGTRPRNHPTLFMPSPPGEPAPLRAASLSPFAVCRPVPPCRSHRSIPPGGPGGKAPRAPWPGKTGERGTARPAVRVPCLTHLKDSVPVFGQTGA